MFPSRPCRLLRLLRLVLVLAAGLASAARAAVQVEICENGLDNKDEWPTTTPVASERFAIPAFALDLLPGKFVDDGLRGERPSPSLVRLTGTTVLPAGKFRVLLRSRSAARLYLDGKLVVETPFAPKAGGDGSQHDTERLQPLDLGRGFRFAPGGEYERVAECELPGGVVDVRLEAFAGGREGKAARRVELGETVAAFSPLDCEQWQILAPEGAGFPYTDGSWEGYQSRVHASLAQWEADVRRTRRAAQDSMWQAKHAAARAALATTPDLPLPVVPEVGHPIDRFLIAKYEAVRTQNVPARAGSVDYFKDVKPLLESRCLECHRGNKAKGGLRLDLREAALSGGDNGPALVLGKSADSQLIERITSRDRDEMMPPKGERLTPTETALLRRWIDEGVAWPEFPLVRTEVASTCDDLTFLRRLMLDTLGVPPSAAEASAFARNQHPAKRTLWIDRVLNDPRWADAWMPVWQDLLAENPNILNPTLNNTGPFRWWLHDALSDDLPMDRMVTQLILQRGAPTTGGPAGFGLASQNDAPFAAKATIVSAALLGVDAKCARCHDSPTGSTRQEHLFQLGAMLADGPIDVPTTSSVDPVKLHAGGRKPLIEVTLKPGSKVPPIWPFDRFVPAVAAAETSNPRARLAALLTHPRNERFAEVMVNRIWARFMGRGIVEPLDDWEKGTPTHPELLRWLGREFVRSGYQVKAIARLILTSAAYQRATDRLLKSPDPLYTAVEPRRLLAEQVVDSLLASTGKAIPTEPLCLDLNGRRDVGNSLNLGVPRRAWMLASLSNERDRPSLMLPRLQALADVLSALGWRGARQDPSSTRDTAPNALQPAILANGVLSGWLTRLTDEYGLTKLALDASSPEALIDELFLRILTRQPSAEERARFVRHISEGFASRKLEEGALPSLEKPHRPPPFVTWTNHLWPESNTAKLQVAAEARQGEPPTTRLAPAWRERCEDVLWALLNSPELLYRP